MTIQIKDTIDIECLNQALENMQKAKTAHDNAREAFDGYSWGYHGSYYIKRMEDTAEEFGNILNKLIQDAVTNALAKHNIP